MVRFVTNLLMRVGCHSGARGIIVNWHTLGQEDLRAQLDLLGRWFDFIRLEELPARLRLRSKRPFCLLTFDDGKRSNYTVAAPELERRKLSAVFYVVTDSTSTGETLWFDRRELLIRYLGHCPEGLDLETLKRLPLKLLTARLERECSQYSFPDLDDDHRLMTWVQARDLSRRGFVIGAHGRTHAILTRESRTDAMSEIRQSIEAVGSELNAPCQSFAFPNGSYTPELAHYAAQCGVSSVMTTNPSWVGAHAGLNFLPRIQLFPRTAPAKLELKLALARFPGALANPNGTGRKYAVVRERTPQPAANSWVTSCQLR